MLGMKKRVLEAALKALGWVLEREGGSHEIWSKGKHTQPIPRSREVKELTAQRIIKTAKKLGGKDPKGR